MVRLPGTMPRRTHPGARRRWSLSAVIGIISGNAGAEGAGCCHVRDTRVRVTFVFRGGSPSRTMLGEGSSPDAAEVAMARILLIDDDPEFANYLGDRLREQEHAVQCLE